MKYLQLLVVIVSILFVFCTELQKVDEDNINNKNQTCTELGTTGDDPDDEVGKNPFALEFIKERDVLQIHDILHQKIKGFTIKKFFVITSGRRLHVRSMLPYVRQYIASKVEAFHKLDLKLVFQLLAKLGQVFRVAYAGCKGYTCSRNVYKLMGQYQNLITKSRRLSGYMVLRCIRSLKYHWYAYSKRRSKPRAIFHLNRTIPVALKIRSDSQVVVNKTEVMRTLSETASKQARSDLFQSGQEVKDYENEKKKYEDDYNKYEESVTSLKKQVEDYKALITSNKNEEAKIDTKEEFVRKRSIVSQKCVLVETTEFKEVCKTVYILFFGYKNCKLVEGKTTKQDCRDLLDKGLFDFRKEQLRSLAATRKELRDKRLDIEERKLQIQKMQHQQFAELQMVGKKLTRFTKLANLHKHKLSLARTSLDLASRGMTIVQTQLERMVDFWDNVVQHAADIVREARDNTTDDDVNGMKERILTSGFSWLALGKVLRIAHHELRLTSGAVGEAFMTFPTTSEVQGVINGEANEILETTIALSRKYEKRIKETEDKIFELKCEKKNNNIDVDTSDEFEIEDGDDVDGEEDDVDKDINDIELD